MSHEEEVNQRIAEQVGRAASVRDFLDRLQHCKTSTEFAVAHKPIPGTEFNRHPSRSEESTMENSK